jgi:hypothetical protein
MIETKELDFSPSNIETVDQAFYEWINEYMNVFSTTSEGWKKVPVIWLSAERAYQLKADKDLRDSSGMLKLPLVSIERISINKDPAKTGAFPANIREVNDEKGGTVTIARRVNQVKTSNFQNADNKKYGINKVYPLYSTGYKKQDKIVYQTITVPVPIHLNIMYNLHIKCDYMQQLNEIITPFFTKNGNTRNFVFTSKDKHKFEAFIKGDFGVTNNSSNLGVERKMYTSKIEIEVLGRIFGQGDNQEKPKIVIRENAVEVKIPREHVILADDIDFSNLSKNKTKYRE